MKKGDKIIWDSHFGYEIGYFIEESNENMYNTYKVDMITGIVTGEFYHSKNEIYLYSSAKQVEMQEKYGYVNEFNEPS